MAGPAENAGGRTQHLALRWMLILATALLLLPPGEAAPAPLATLLILAFAASNLALGFAGRAVFESRGLQYVLVMSDTFLVSLALFHAGPPGGQLPLVFFLTLILAALGPDLPRAVAGATLVSILYVYLTGGGAWTSGAALAPTLLRVPFLYVVALYFGHLVHRARREQELDRRLKGEKRDLETFLEVTRATTSTLNLHEVLFRIVQQVARLVGALRCSILTVDETRAACAVLASSDDPAVDGLPLDLGKYPEVRRALETRAAVIIDDVAREPMLAPVRRQLEALHFQSILVVPMVSRDSLLGVLVLRAARTDRPFTATEIASCQVVANASASALRNAMLHEQTRIQARSRQEAADQLQSILDHVPDLIFTTDLEGRTTEWNRGGRDLFALERAGALGRPAAGLFDEPEARGRMEDLIRDGRPIRDLETTVRRADGSVIDVLLTAAPLRDAEGRRRGTIGIVRDVTELRTARRHLQQTEKLSAIGEVVSGVAHELNNPLAGVLGYAQLLMAHPMEGRQKRSLERIFESALRCQKIVQNLLAFSRRHPSEKRHLGLNGIVEKTLELKAYQLKVNNIRVVTRLDAALPKTMLDFNQIQQVLLNVVNNAQHAIGSHRGSGTLTVTTALHEGRIRLTIDDDGPGIPPDVLGRIFDPFFTTKPVGEGTGLGLSVSYGIVRDHGGRIWAESRAGEGTRLVVELPVLGESRPLARGPSEAEAAGANGPLRILAVDDEPVILDLAVDVLGREGHRVDTAGSAREAIAKLEQGGYDVLILDLKMPETDGRALFREIEGRWPDLAGRVIFASGDTVHLETRSFIDASGRPCLDKPFQIQELSAAVAAVAAGGQAPAAAAAR